MPRQSEFTQEIADLICERLANGESLRAICRDEAMPHAGTVCRWAGSNEAFREQYAQAREAQADALFDEMLEIADDGRNDWMERKDEETGECVGWRENGESTRRSAIRLDARKWMAGKLQPKKYGDRVDHNHNGDLNIRYAVSDKPVTPEEWAAKHGTG